MKKLNKKEIKSYSNQILKTCKLWGYNADEERFENFFDDDEAFNFIPCYKKGIESCVDDEELEEFIESFGEIVDEIIGEALDNNIKIELSTEEIEAFANENYDSLGEYIVEKKDPDPELLINWIANNCDKQTKEKFLNWALK